MINNSLIIWRGGPRSLIKKIFIGYLALVTGCTSIIQQVEQTGKAEQTGRSAFESSTQIANGPGVGHPSTIAGTYNLPDLGGSAVKQEPRSTPHGLMGDFSGDMPQSAQQNVADPRASGYQDAEAFQNLAAGYVTSASTDAVKKWFSAKNATAELSLSAGKGGSKTGSFDLLMPLYDAEKDLVFTQVGIRRSNAHTEDYRSTVNIGAGYRRTLDTWLVGANVFYDRDITGKNDRLGIGAEAWTDFLKLSANGYIRLSDWKASPDLMDYLERPANGYDLRVEANLPAYPQIGGKLVYEQYFGDQVGLFSAANRQKDPKAVTVGLTYNPVPMIGLGVDYRQGQNGLSETTGKMTLNYQFGVPLEKQLSTAYSVNHKLINTRYNLVSRNNEIVLEYREKDAGQIMVPGLIHGTATQTLSFPVTFTDTTIGNFTWTGSGALFALPYGGGANGSVTLPAYNPGGSNLYTLQAVGTDRFGRSILSNVMQIRVDAFQITLNRSKAAGMADGDDAVTFTATLLEPTGEAKQNTEVTWDVQGAATVTEQDTKTDTNGKARLKLVSQQANAVRVTVQEPQGAMAESAAEFSGDVKSARVVSLVATPSSITADNNAISTLVAKIQDANGNDLPAGVKVTWSSTQGTLSATETVTDSNSQATTDLRGKTAGEATVSASAVKGTASAKVTLTSDSSTAKVIGLVATPVTILANGVATSALEATVVDANGNPVANATVTWTSSLGNLSAASSSTDAGGKARVTLKGTTAGSATVNAAAAAGSSSVTVTLTADVSTAKVIDLVATPVTILANGVATSALEATVVDANGNPVANATVTWTSSLGSLSAASSSTDASGKARVTLKGTTAGSATVNAAAAAGSSSVTVTLTADVSTAKVIGLVAMPATIVADGVTISALEATVVDAGGNPVANATVTWTSSLGNLSAASSSTDAGGKARVTLKGTTAGSATVNAAAVAGSSTASVMLTADSSTAKVIGLVATPATILANGVATSSLEATVEDASGNPVANATVTWTSNLGNLSAASSSTDASGKARVTLKGTTAGSATVNAAAVAGSSTASVMLTADSSTAKVIGLVAMPATIVADGVTSSALEATVVDAGGNPVANATVTWTSSLGSLSAASSSTDASGKARVTLKGTTAGSATVNAAAAAGSSSVTVTLTADVSTAKVIDLVATPVTILANGVATSALEATVVDANGNPVANATVTWTSSLGNLSAASSSTDASGKARVTLTGTSVGSANVEASAVAGTSSTVVTLTADNSSAKVIDLVATPATIVADGVMSSALEAKVEDASGHPVPNATVTWSSSLGSLSAASSSTDAGGKARVTLKGTTAGSATVNATAVAGSSSTSVTLTADSSTAKVLSISASPATVPADGTMTTLSATVTDANNNPLGAGITVLWQTDINTLSAASSVTDSNGVAIVTLQGNTAGTATVLAKTTVSGNASTDVVFTSLPPVFLSSAYNRPLELTCNNYGTTPYTTLSWSATGADRYEVFIVNGDAANGTPNTTPMYSGSATSYVIRSIIINYANPTAEFLIKAFKGGTSTSRKLIVPISYNCNDATG